MPTAIARPGSPVNDTASFLQWANAQLRTNPAYRPPHGFHIEHGQVVKDGPRIIDRVGQYAPYVGFAAAGGIGAANAGLFGGGAGASGPFDAGLPGTALGMEAAPSVGATGGAATTGGAGILGKLGGAKGILSAAGKLAPILGKAAGARSDARQAEEQDQLFRDRTNLDRSRAEADYNVDKGLLDLRQRQFSLDAPGTRLGTGVRGSMTANAHNVGVESGDPLTLPSGRSINPVHFTGMGPDDLLSPEARQLGEQVTHDMLLAQMAGDHFEPLPDVTFPSPAPSPKSSFLDKALGAAAFGTSVAGGLSPYLQSILAKSRQPRPIMVGDPTSPGGPYPVA